jgi:pyroglutamyl-peptidase
VPFRVLLTGFEPFAGADDNPSARLAAAFSASQAIDGVELTTAVLPVSAARLPGRLHDLLEAIRPDGVLGLGEARGAPAIRVERIALNLLDFRTPDNDGRVLADTSVVPGGPPAYFTTWPAADLLGAIRGVGVTCDQSLSAGAYLCNQMMYLTLHWAAQRSRPPRVGFLHLPSLPTQNTTIVTACLSMDLSIQQRAVAAVLRGVADRAS